LVGALHYPLRMHTHRVLLFAAAVAAASVGIAPDARAQSEPRPVRWTDPAPSTPSAAPTADTHWYGWETILVDGAALGTMVLGGATGSGAVGGVGVGIYALGPPVVHATHGRTDAMLGDLGIRVAAPLLFGALGYAIDYSTSQCPPSKSGEFINLCFRGLAGMGLGILAGYATAVVLDAAWLAREPVVKKSDGRDALRVRWAPTVAITPTGGSAGVGGLF
jgi:hypothetical protein